MLDPALVPAPPGVSETDEQTRDLAELARLQRRNARAHAAIAVGIFLLGAALAWPVLTVIPGRVLTFLVLLGLAMVGTVAVLAAAARWWSDRYELALPPSWRLWRWRIIRRWYAPGATVWRTDGPIDPFVVLAWHIDPACPVPWVLVYDGTPLMANGGAVWRPLTALAPAPRSASSAVTTAPSAGVRAGGPR